MIKYLTTLGFLLKDKLYYKNFKGYRVCYYLTKKEIVIEHKEVVNGGSYTSKAFLENVKNKKALKEYLLIIEIQKILNSNYFDFNYNNRIARALLEMYVSNSKNIYCDDMSENQYKTAFEKYKEIKNKLKENNKEL